MNKLVETIEKIYFQMILESIHPRTFLLHEHRTLIANNINPSLCMQYRSTCPSGFGLGMYICAPILLRVGQ